MRMTTNSWERYTALNYPVYNVLGTNGLAGPQSHHQQVSES